MYLFFKKEISVLGIHTGAHPQYHTPDDKLELLNIDGQKRICDYIYEAVLFLSHKKEINFTSVE